MVRRCASHVCDFQIFKSLSKLDDLLNSNEIIPNSNAISSINDIENTILKLREIIIYDICKREKLIGELAENLNKEKEIFFKIEE